MRLSHRLLVSTAPVPASGVIGLLATMTTPEDGIICSAFETVDTGTAP